MSRKTANAPESDGAMPISVLAEKLGISPRTIRYYEEIGLLDTVMYDWDPFSWIVEAALMYLLYFIVSLSPVSAAIAAEIVLQEEGSLLYFWYDVDSGHRIIIPSFWISYTVIYLVLALLLLLITILRVRRQEQQ